MNGASLVPGRVVKPSDDGTSIGAPAGGLVPGSVVASDDDTGTHGPPVSGENQPLGVAIQRTRDCPAAGEKVSYPATTPKSARIALLAVLLTRESIPITL
jgi:hypothetical protein